MVALAKPGLVDDNRRMLVAQDAVHSQGLRESICGKGGGDARRKRWGSKGLESFCGRRFNVK